MPIRRLPQSLVNKIAAGEVIERPASVVKELMENAIDAGATRVDVSIQTGGMEMIRVADNGSGIPVEELPLALASHATSKLGEVDDLFRVATLGFRGEALASIGEVSHLTLRSRTPDSPGGWQLEVHGGQVSEIAPCGCPVGTVLEVSNLFFNTPVRRKFLRSGTTEMGHVAEAFTRIALPLPQVHCTLRHNERPVFELSAAQGWLDRIEKFFGREVAESLIWVDSGEGPIRLSGYVAHPSQSRSNNRMQYLFLNRRFIRDRALQHALGEAYRGLLMTGRYPIAFLSLEMPPDLVDVNVHPTKLEVRFQDSGRVYSQLLATLRSKFLTTDLTARATAPEAQDPTALRDEEQAVQMRQQVVDWAKGQVAGWSRPAADAEPSRGSGGGTEAWPKADREGPPQRTLELTRLDRSWRAVDVRPGGEEDDPFGAPASAAPADRLGGAALPIGSEPASGGPASMPTAWPDDARKLQALQIHNRYLVAESEDGVMVIDQHALHERILYEQLRQRIAAGAVEAQNLLVPEPVDLLPAEAATAIEHRELLARLGMRIEPFGGGTILIAAYPAMLSNMNPAEVLRGLLEQLLAGAKTPDRHDLLDDLLHTVACKAAIKAGDRLNPEEIASLLEQRHLVDNAHHCPHGRPTALVFTREELDKQFKRL